MEEHFFSVPKFWQKKCIVSALLYRQSAYTLNLGTESIGLFDFRNIKKFFVVLPIEPTFMHRVNTEYQRTLAAGLSQQSATNKL